jgi:exosome complex component CSL4
MKAKTGDFVLPGDALGVTEEFLPSEWTYDDHGEIRSLVAGTVNIDQKNKKISIIPKTKSPALLKRGEVIVGQIRDVRGQRALVDVDGIKNSKRSLPITFLGAIHISQAQKGYVDKLTDNFHIGDLIQARVTKVMGVDNADLTTAEDELGVIKAMCTNCRHFMKKTSKNEVKCPNCGKKESRNLSSTYEG